MSTPLLYSALALALLSSATLAQGKRLTLEQASGRGEDGVDFRGKLESWDWAPDGVHLVKGSGDEKKWIDPRTGEESAPTQVEDAEDAQRDARKEGARKALESLVGEKLGKRVAGRRLGGSEDGSVSVFEYEDTLYVWSDGGAARELSGPDASGLSRELLDVAPDGSRAAFVRGNDLFSVDLSTGQEQRWTEDGGDDVFNGKLDWVYQEELYGRGRFKAFWWSPDSTHIAFLRLDEAEVHDFTLIDHIEKGHLRVKPEVTAYPKAGDPNPTVGLAVAHVGSGALSWIDLERYAADEPLVVRVDWTPAGKLWFVVQDRIQTRADVNEADPETGEYRTVIPEHSESWVSRPGTPHWLDGGGFLWLSAHTGYEHLYRFDAAGEPMGLLTQGEWPVGSVLDVDEERGQVWFSAAKDGATDSNVYRVGLDGSGLVRLTQGEGSHSIEFNDDKSLFLDRVSSLASPAEVRLCDADGKVLKVLARSEVPDLEVYATSAWEKLEIPARDGFLLDAALLKPTDFDPAQSYPVWVPTYSGPNAPSVRNRWNSSAWYQFLAQQGICVLQVNVRTASGKGHAVISKCYKQLLVQELDDMLDAVAWLTKNPWADASRVGITGYSYGGSMTAYALTHSKAFALGIAGGGVYHWGMYDSIYTERYMSTPQKNPEGYEKTSVLNAAKDLSGRLVMHHGVMDDNVHVQNAMQFVYALQKAGKRFDFMLYPQTRHGVRDADQRWHLRLMEWEAISETLGGAQDVDGREPVEAVGGPAAGR